MQTKLKFRYIYYKGEWTEDGGIKVLPSITEWTEITPFQFKLQYGVKYNKFEVRSTSYAEHTEE